MTMTPAEFRVLFPEFSLGEYPDQTVGGWLAVAALSLNAERWGALFNHGTALWVAHHLASGMGKVGGGVASQGGIAASKSVDKVSVSYDTGASTIEGGAHWNTTRYGVEWLKLARMIGSGGLQL